ncbi:MAG TPA: Hpt domain-containing protein, partial [Brevundimonas sp.]
SRPTEVTGPEDPLAALSRRYADHIKTLSAEIDRLSEQSFEQRAEGLANLAHAVAGTAGTLGFPSLSEAAFELEDCARQVISGDVDGTALEPAVQAFRDALNVEAASRL